MECGQAVQYLLRQSVDLSALVGGRIHSGWIPQDETMPAVLIEEVDAVPEAYISAFDQPREWSTRVQITVIAGTYARVKIVLRTIGACSRTHLASSTASKSVTCSRRSLA